MKNPFQLSAAYGLTELLIALTILGTIASIPITAVRDTLVAQRGRTSAQNLRIIEAAKRSFAVNNPGESLTELSQLAPYLPHGQLPAGAHKGETYTMGNLSSPATSSANGVAAFEPWGNFGALTENNFNDLGKIVVIYPTLSVTVPALEAGNLMDVAWHKMNTGVYDLSVKFSEGGTVTIEGGGTTIKRGETATLHATADVGYGFAGWSGDAVGSETTITVMANEDDFTITALFLPCRWAIGYSEWTECVGATCSEPGTRMDIIPYVPSTSDCVPATAKPEDEIVTTESCGPLPAGIWLVGDWSEPDVNTGLRTRTVLALPTDDGCPPTTPEPAAQM